MTARSVPTPFRTRGTATLTWRGLETVCAATVIVASLLLAISLPGMLVITGWFTAGLLLTRWRSGVVGAVLLTWLFGSMTVFLAASTVEWLREAQSVEVLFGALLRGIGVAGLAAAIASIRHGHTTGAPIAASAGVAVAVLVVIAGLFM